MDEKTAIKQRLEKLKTDVLREISELYALLEEGVPHLPPEAIEQMAEGLCLRCKKRITKQDRPKVRRGNHDHCYRKNQRDIKSGLTTDDDLVKRGLWAPKKDGGRPRKDIPANDLLGKAEPDSLDS